MTECISAGLCGLNEFFIRFFSTLVGTDGILLQIFGD